MSSSVPKISVVLTTYNRARVLPITLDSILAQTERDFELIISDDCSPDETERVCREYEKRDRRVRYRRNANNLKMPGNLNAGIAEARGEYIANLHDGDMYRSDLLEKWASALDRYPRAAFVFNQYEASDRHGRKLYTIDMPDCMNGHEFLRRIYVTQWGCPVFGTVMARKACYDAVGPFDSRYSFHSDIEMWVRLAFRYDVAHVPEPLIHVTAREDTHIMGGKRWWELTVDVRVKRQALHLVAPQDMRAKLAFELRARMHYAFQALPALKHGRWHDIKTALYMAATGRDDVSPPY
jgi:glycosyltransferase involved in cell wall biosynthesis